MSISTSLSCFFLSSLSHTIPQAIPAFGIHDYTSYLYTLAVSQSSQTLSQMQFFLDGSSILFFLFSSSASILTLIDLFLIWLVAKLHYITWRCIVILTLAPCLLFLCSFLRVEMQHYQLIDQLAHWLIKRLHLYSLPPCGERREKNLLHFHFLYTMQARPRRNQ